jgi:hypothetical protein
MTNLPFKYAILQIDFDTYSKLFGNMEIQALDGPVFYWSHCICMSDLLPLIQSRGKWVLFQIVPIIDSQLLYPVPVWSNLRSFLVYNLSKTRHRHSYPSLYGYHY